MKTVRRSVHVISVLCNALPGVPEPCGRTVCDGLMSTTTRVQFLFVAWEGGETAGGVRIGGGGTGVWWYKNNGANSAQNSGPGKIIMSLNLESIMCVVNVIYNVCVIPAMMCKLTTIHDGMQCVYVGNMLY